MRLQGVLSGLEGFCFGSCSETGILCVDPSVLYGTVRGTPRVLGFRVWGCAADAAG